MLSCVRLCVTTSTAVLLQWNTWSKDQEEHQKQDYNKDEVAAGFQNFLICIEMFFAALAHAYAFPPKDYMDPGLTLKSGFVYGLRVMFDVRDVVDDVEDVVNDTVRIAFLLQVQYRICVLFGTTAAQD